MFTLKNVKYKNILDLVDISFKEGIVTAILGESGGGKTTLLKLLNQLISQDSGSIKYNDQAIESYHPIELRRQVVMLPQTPAIFPGTLKDNLLIGLKYAEKSLASDGELTHALSLVKLQKQLDREIETFSGGEKQRMALARIILTNAPVMLLDEPTSALDQDTGNFVMERLCELVIEKKKTIIMVTHSRPLAEQYAHELIHMNEINRKKVVHSND